MTARLSKFVLTSHIIFSVGWLGAVAVFLAIAITGITSQDAQLARATYLVMELTGWFVIVPFCFASLVTGVVQALRTKWGLFNHYWIVVKLILTIAATILLLLHMKPIGYLAEIAAGTSFSISQLPGLQIQLIADAGGALLLLLVTTTLSVYKPWGKIQFDLRDHKQYAKVMRDESTITKKPWGFFILIGLTTLILLFIIIHLFGGGMGGN